METTAQAETDRQERERQCVRRIAVYHIPAMVSILIFSVLAVLLPRDSAFARWAVVTLVAGTIVYNIRSVAKHLSDPIFLDYSDGAFSGERRHGVTFAIALSDVAQVVHMSFKFGSGRSYWGYYRLWLRGERPFVYVDQRYLTLAAAAELEKLEAGDPWVVG
jgi:hypothetical protein